MSRKLSRIGLAVVVTGAAALALGGGSAAAAPPQKYSYSNCFSYPGYYTYCYTDTVTYKTTITPSGNEQYWAHIRSSYSETGIYGNYSSESKYSYRYFYKDGVPFFYGDQGKGSYTSNGITCTYKYRFVYVNGEYRVERYDSQCTPTT